MRVRMRFDIGWKDLAAGVLACCWPGGRSPLIRQADQYWGGDGKSVVCLSVRSAFDLLLSTLNLPSQSEVLMTALTVPDMPRIVRHHGLVPIPVDLVPNGCTPSFASLQRALSPRTRMLVVAHLFGTRIDMEPLIAFARQHQLVVVEDCAQAYDGPTYSGHHQSDVALFSFGPIKTATALGGGVMRLRSAELAQRTVRLQRVYPESRHRSYLARLIKYTIFKLLTSQIVYGGIATACRICRCDSDQWIARAARNFSPTNLIDQLRRQPSTPLLRMLLRRWRRYDPGRLQRRTANGRALAMQLKSEQLPAWPGACSHNYWVFPVLTDDREQVVAAMRKGGFDATWQSRLVVVDAPPDRPELTAHHATQAMERIVFLPWYPELSRREIDLMARILQTPMSQPIAREPAHRGNFSSELPRARLYGDAKQVVDRVIY